MLLNEGTTLMCPSCKNGPSRPGQDDLGRDDLGLERRTRRSVSGENESRFIFAVSQVSQFKAIMPTAC